ncbi:DUF983 domain-containing protein [Kiloniella laminariae]|uniref:DUF983 domain-containing protein n=1 Tax=Kiloniella laminariae TaxID=454162 RepID=A0ABT4LPT1_9PROT|nr:DUF983 domain-containing protein [Kiloniella laminariae]MCZ4282900.1 DUF983 domain-containing protein [Kiloniella laminariae]
MSENKKNSGEFATSAPEERSAFQALKRGLRRKCPCCGTGNVFRKYVTVEDECAVCGEELGHIRADDIPPYFTIMLVGHIVVPGVMWSEQSWAPSLWAHVAIWPALTLALTLAFLPFIKGGVLGVLWALKMFEDEKRYPVTK